MSRPAAAPCWDRGVPARTEFCADLDGFQTTWLRSCASRHQRRPNFRAESRSCCLRHARRDRTSPHLLAGTPSLESGRPGCGPRHRVFCASMADGFHNHPPLGLARGPLAAHSGHSGPRLVLPHETTTKYRRHVALRLGCRLGECLARHDHRKPDRGEAAGPAPGGDPGRSPLPQRRADAGGDRPCAQAGQLDWLIVGGESGVGDRSRPMHTEWVPDLRDQARAVGGAFFLKQIGSSHALWPGAEADPPRRAALKAGTHR